LVDGLFARESGSVGRTAPSSPLPITVTYIANEGFLIEAAGKKVLIDALFDGGQPDYMVPSPELLGQIETGKGPFAAVDLILATHVHGDHFSPAIILRYLRAHPRCHFAAHKQVVDTIRGDRSFPDVRKQVHELDLLTGVRGQVALEGITVDALCLNDGAPQREVKNLVFLVDMGGARFLHMGDAFLWDRQNDIPLDAYPFERAHIDLLFLNQYDRGPARTRDLIANRIKPSHLVIMHIGPGEFAAASQKLHASFPLATLFEKPMERRVFR
jgi:L-ascorbate metabolism protein UlaG (beta-lactamase superfamily)